MNTDPVVIVSAARTPMGGLQGALGGLSAPDLGATAIRAAVERSGINPAAVQEVVMGCVLPAGQGQAPARQASLGAGLPLAAGCTTVNKMCGSGMKAAMLAHDSLLAGSSQVMVAGGMESMSNAPYLLAKARGGYRLGHGQLYDHLFLDGLEDAYDKGRLMGTFAEDCAEAYQFTRQTQDAFAITSLTRARRAIEDGTFKAEVTPVTVKDKKGESLIEHDEQPLTARLDKIPQLKPAFRKDGTVTPANSSSISDGAAALVLMRRSEAERRGIAPLARILGHATHAQEPARFTTAPVGAIQKLLEKVNWKARDVDLYEINEAFAVVTLAAMRELDLAHDKVNVHGGACALGHPIGASGARILVTLLYALEKYGLKRGVASLCIGGGEAIAMAIERP
ncbi:MAG: acetyl-CoA C-acetyltransferase [Gammaproteobacteria bacterium]